MKKKTFVKIVYTFIFAGSIFSLVLSILGSMKLVSFYPSPWSYVAFAYFGVLSVIVLYKLKKS